MTAAGTDLDTRPECGTCGVYLDLRTKPVTPEQAWCGVWYDHPPTQFGLTGHTASALLPSAELVAAWEATR